MHRPSRLPLPLGIAVAAALAACAGPSITEQAPDPVDPVDTCAVLDAHRARRVAAREIGEGWRGAVDSAPTTAALPQAMRDCVRADDGAAWGVAFRKVTVGGSADAPTWNGALDVVRVGPDGLVHATDAGATYVAGAAGHPRTDVLLKSLPRRTGEVLLQVTARRVVEEVELTDVTARAYAVGPQGDPSEVVSLRPLAPYRFEDVDGDGRLDLMSVRALRASHDLCVGDDAHVAFAVPYHQAPDGTFAFDDIARLSLAERCNAAAALEARVLIDEPPQRVVDAFGCAWVGGRPTAEALGGIERSCAARRDDEDLACSAPACLIVDALKVTLSQAPPVQL